MPRFKYRYNIETCKFEPIKLNGKQYLMRIGLFILLSTAVAVIAMFTHNNDRQSLTEVMLSNENKALHSEWLILQKRIDEVNTELTALIEKDDHNYRIILDSQPLSTSIREAGTGGREIIWPEELNSYPTILSSYKKVNKLKHQLGIEQQSFNEITELLDQKMKMWASRPAIQPIDNSQLDRLHLTYGKRLHPIFKVYMDHKGLDFTASKGTPIYATGDGRIAQAYYSSSYGNVIFINHGHGFETRYAHLSKFAVKPGEKVKRGQLIGYVGNTGNSVSDHLHYEVLVNGQHINPINFFQRDLNNKEYQRLIRIGSQQQQVLD